MDTVKILPSKAMGRQFVPNEFLPQGEDEYYLRNAQLNRPDREWRQLHAHELEQLVKNGNTAADWEEIRVTDEFDPNQILNSSFFGLVRIGAVRDVVLEHHDLQMPVGITNSTIVSCDIGDNAAIHNVRYLAHFIIGDRCILTNVDEMHTTNHAKFGNGIVKDGEPESVLVTLDLVNETGSRDVCPFDGMIPADAYLWARYRDDEELQQKFHQLTRKRFDSRRGYYGTVGEQSVIKSCRIIKDVKIGAHCYIKGANKLKNLTINSSADESSQIGEGVELVNGIIGPGCRIFYGCKAVRFVMGTNCELKYGARLIHSYLGDNSTVSCCELLNNLIFPAHEQHHNNSFLVASLVLGQSNIAAGATIGSNHNSRANDNEILAGRGFWPGLESSLKHSSRFASFNLIAKGAYPAEMDIPLPFALLSNNVSQNRLDIMPAFWWLYNMYALARNSWKFGARDRRKHKTQKIEFDSLAPDTVEEIITAMDLLEQWTAQAMARPESDGSRAAARQALLHSPDQIESLEVVAPGLERSRRKSLIIRPHHGYNAYRQMLHYYAATNLVAYLEAHKTETFAAMRDRLAGPRVTAWINIGGQLVPEDEIDQLRADIRSGKLGTWEAVHERYDLLWSRYPLQKQQHAFSVFCLLVGSGDQDSGAAAGTTPGLDDWSEFLDEAVRIQQLKRDRVYSSRKKDYDNPFRRATYRNDAEMFAAIGTIEDNSFVQQVRAETESFESRVAEIKGRG